MDLVMLVVDCRALVRVVAVIVVRVVVTGVVVTLVVAMVVAVMVTLVAIRNGDAVAQSIGHA